MAETEEKVSPTMGRAMGRAAGRVAPTMGRAMGWAVGGGVVEE